jgi:hypothetical protein
MVGSLAWEVKEIGEGCNVRLRLGWLLFGLRFSCWTWVQAVSLFDTHDLYRHLLLLYGCLCLRLSSPHLP